MTGNCCVHRKVVRRASLSDRHNLCRKEYETEAIVWRGGRGEEPEKEKETDQENNQIVQVRIRSFIWFGFVYCFAGDARWFFVNRISATIRPIRRRTNDAVLFIKGLFFKTYAIQNHSLLSCRSNRSRQSSNQRSPGCRPSSKMAPAHRMASSPRRRPRRHLRPPTAPCQRLTEAARPPRRSPGRKSVPKRCLSWKNRGLQPSCWITLCLMVTLATALRTPSLMPNPTQRTPECPWSPPMGVRFTTRRPAATRPSSNWNSQQRTSSQRRRPAAVCRSCHMAVDRTGSGRTERGEAWNVLFGGQNRRKEIKVGFLGSASFSSPGWPKEAEHWMLRVSVAQKKRQSRCRVETWSQVMFSVRCESGPASTLHPQETAHF